MRLDLALLAGLFLIGSAPALGQADAAIPECAWPPAAKSSGAWADPGRWAKLRQGMTRFDVLQLLGEPGKLSSYDGFERWEYPAALGARVNFDDRGKVSSWLPRRLGSVAH
jgi:outer membrane protein assembly factor BamE (lipoprotein component of BamABCDE complex)